MGGLSKITDSKALTQKCDIGRDFWCNTHNKGFTICKGKADALQKENEAIHEALHQQMAQPGEDPNSFECKFCKEEGQ